MSSAVLANKRVLKERRLRSLLEAEDAAALQDEPTGKPATIVFRGFGGPLPTNWQESLPLDEDVLAVAVGSNWAAAATSRQVLACGCVHNSQHCMRCGLQFCVYACSGFVFFKLVAHKARSCACRALWCAWRGRAPCLAWCTIAAHLLARASSWLLAFGASPVMVARVTSPQWTCRSGKTRSSAGSAFHPTMCALAIL